MADISSDSSSGYRSALYADSFAELGTARQLPSCGGWILVRPVPGWSLADGMGCYPLFACADWSKLRFDLKDLSKELVSLVVVTDPFGNYDLEHLNYTFELVKPFKEHWVVDLSRPAAQAISKHHQRDLRNALRKVEVERCEHAIDYLDEWERCYQHLQVKHGIAGIQAFSRSAFEKQLRVPGLVMFRASVRGEVAGMHLWYRERDVAYHHLGATTTEGYKLQASYALMWHAIEYFRPNTTWLDLGGVPGADNNPASGLRRFKTGWATGTRPSYLCGRIFQAETYRQLVKDRCRMPTEYFPAYRAGEHTGNTSMTVPHGA